VIASYVHSAGTTEMIPIKAITSDKIHKMLNTNFVSAAMITKTLTQKKNNGTELENIIYISSNISNSGGKTFAAYAASKGALDSFMRCASVELAPRIRVNSILPGGMRTEMTKEIFEDDELVKRMEFAYPLGMGNPEDIAGVVKFLLSEESKWITGQQITVDGGRNINITA
jgi:NAD(P)-dependent dehydrogenase (short-subunit alcohol dehydrogenase family)